MRLGQNPAKAIDHVAKPARITVAVVTYIPFLGGYYSQSLEVLKACLESIWQNTDPPYDLLVFDNASCAEVRAYLAAQQQEGRIQFLLLSEKNIGKGGAWNFIFAGAPGEIIAYADSDIYFYPGWLAALTQVLEKFPNCGMVTGMPMWSPAEYSTSTLRWAESQAEARVERGKLLAWEDYWRHARSLGQSETEAQANFAAQQDICLHYQGQRYYIGAGHFQFVARREVLQRALPIPSERPMGQVRSLDKLLNEAGYLRLATPEWWIQHMGNTTQGLEAIQNAKAVPEIQPSQGKPGGLLSWRPVRRLLLWTHNKTFNLLYRS